jgi:hypothetical protein
MHDPFANPQQDLATRRNPHRIILPGLNGIPFRGPTIPDLKSDDPRQPVEVMDGGVKVFNLSIPEELAAYNQIWDLICKGVAFGFNEQITWSEKFQNYVVLVRFAGRFMEMPESLNQRMGLDNHGQLHFSKR